MSKLSEMSLFKDLYFKVEKDYFLGIEVEKGTDLNLATLQINNFLKEEFGEEYKIVECHHHEKFLIIEEHYVLETNLPYNLFSLKENESIPSYMLYADDGWVNVKFLETMVEDLIFQNKCLRTGNYKNRYGLDSEEVKKFFKEYEKYIQELYDNCIARKYGIYKLWENFYIDSENVGDFYTIYKCVWKKENPFTKISFSSFTKGFIK